MNKVIPISKIDYFELEPENNIFYSVVADITHRCNMECANCYIPNRNILDMDADKLIDCISRFPKRSEIRLIGAEPTVRKDLEEIIIRIRETGHRPVMMTNGLKLANYDYAKKIYDAGLKTVNISMNGADDDAVYIITDELKCAKRKMKALKNSLWYICLLAGSFIGCTDNSKKVQEENAEWNMGVALYSFNRFSFADALDKADSAEVNYVEGFSFHKMGKEFNIAPVAKDFERQILIAAGNNAVDIVSRLGRHKMVN